MKRREASAQDDAFELTEISGLLVDGLVAFVDGADDGRPAAFLLTLGDGSVHHFFLDAFLGFWRELSSEDECLQREAYADCRIVDYGVKCALRGSTLERVSCSRNGVTTLVLQFSVGELRVFEEDGSDPHSDSLVTFHAR